MTRRRFFLLALPLALVPACRHRPGLPAGAPATLRIFLARHGQTDWNLKKKIQGSTDVPINGLGREQAKALGEAFVGLPLERIFTSALARTRETAAIAFPDILHEALAGLDEQDMGSFQGLELNGSEPEREADYRRRGQDPDDSFAGGESANQHFLRVKAALARIREQNPSGSVAIVGHLGTNRLILRALLDLSAEEARAIDEANDERYLIEIDGRGKARLYKSITRQNLGDL